MNRIENLFTIPFLKVPLLGLPIIKQQIKSTDDVTRNRKQSKDEKKLALSNRCLLFMFAFHSSLSTSKTHHTLQMLVFVSSLFLSVKCF